MRSKIMTGLTSITFRALDWRAVVAVTKDCGLDGIEWGGDIHVPPGGEARAREVRRATEEAGLAVLSYGSYYRLGEGEPFEPVLASAQALGAKIIRVWAGAKGSAQTTAKARARAVEDARRVADMAQAQGTTVALEYHRNTLTDTSESAAALLSEAGRGNLKSYWQPNPELRHEENLRELGEMLPWLTYLHVFQWEACGRRCCLQDGEAEWRAYMRVAKKHAQAAILEFVRDDAPAQCAKDAETLRRICG